MREPIQTPDDDAVGEIVEGLLRFVDSVVLPIETQNAALLNDPRRAYDERGAHTPEVRRLKAEVRMQSAQAGYYTMFAPTSVGGGGYGSYVLYRAWEALHRRYGPGRILPYASVAHWAYGPSVLCTQLTPAAAEQMLQPYVAGKTTSCFGMSEPDAGSDAWAMRTRATRDGDDWVISGTKQWITNSPTADYIFVFAVTDEALKSKRKGGVSCFLVPMNSPGLKVDSVIKLFGNVGGDEGIVSFTDVRAPATALVGELHRGFDLALAGVSIGRMYNAGRCVGLARWALEKSTDYAKQRVAFGQPIAEYQGISFPLADCATDIYAAETMSVDCARRLDRGESAIEQVSMVKLFTTEMCSRVYERCMQAHGGMGLTNEMKLYDGWHQARYVRIADGAAEIMRRNIARSILK
jgi:acyl-CoA dehydrogenase